MRRASVAAWVTTMLVTLTLSAPPAHAAELLGGFGGPAGFGSGVLAPGDDSLSAIIDISALFPEGVAFYGARYSAIRIDTNGRITFESPDSPDATSQMIRVFFADHDTRNRSGLESDAENLIYYHVADRPPLVVTWYRVGRFSQDNNELNSYQLLISSDGDGGGVEVELRYEACKWVRGERSASFVLSDGFASVGSGWRYVHSGTERAVELCDDSNVGESGVWRIDVNAEGVVQPSLEFCGDGEVAGAEQCDDGARVAGDGCSERCFWEVDTDRDGVWDAEDNCPAVANPGLADADYDNVGDVCDLCPEHYNPDTVLDDEDGDGIGDVCDQCLDDTGNDPDGDGVCAAEDNCHDAYNPIQIDTDRDGLGDACDEDDDDDGVLDVCDNCPTVVNPGQENEDDTGDVQGDACDNDSDNDGVADVADCAPNDAAKWLLLTVYDDQDRDGFGSGSGRERCLGDDRLRVVHVGGDNCPMMANELQLDADDDGVGDPCDPDRDNDGVVDDGDGSGVEGDGPCLISGSSLDCDDNCLFLPNSDQANSDGRGVGDACVLDTDGDRIPDDLDPCPTLPAPDGHSDADGDGMGDRCDVDRDGDGVPNSTDFCPDTFGTAADGCVAPEPEPECPSAGEDVGVDAGPDAESDAGPTVDASDDAADASDDPDTGDAEADTDASADTSAPDGSTPADAEVEDTAAVPEADEDERGSARAGCAAAPATALPALWSLLGLFLALVARHTRCVAGLSLLLVIPTLTLSASPAQAAELRRDFGGAVGFGTGVLAPGDDAPSAAIDITSAFPEGIAFYGARYSAIQISTNGDVTLENPDSPDGTSQTIAVFFADHDTRNREGLESDDENLIYYHVFDGSPLVVTWYRVGRFREDNNDLNSYQLLISPAGEAGGIEVELRYEVCKWARGERSASFILGDGVARVGSGWRYVHSGSERIVEICDDSNVGEPGVWRIDVDGEGVVQPSIDLCGDGEVSGAEQCDDGARVPGDGCSERCYWEVDGDSDGVWDGEDNCPSVANPGLADADFDNIGDACDLCPNAYDLLTSFDDEDGDGVGDFCDFCLGDAGNDPDGDEVCAADDNCPGIANGRQTDTDDDGAGDACDEDSDDDGVLDVCDNCPTVVNPRQENEDDPGDAQGDACDNDSDNDGVADVADCAPNDASKWVSVRVYDDPDLDRVGSGVGRERCLGDDRLRVVHVGGDNCPLMANELQLDADDDGLGDLCDPDRDNDGVLDDGDGSGVVGDSPCTSASLPGECDDNCLFAPNPDQATTPRQGVGDACVLDLDGDRVADERDLCPTLSARYVHDDGDSDGIGDRCDIDRDGDGVPNSADFCPDTLGTAADGCVAPEPEPECPSDGEDVGVDAGPDAESDAGPTLDASDDAADASDDPDTGDAEADTDASADTSAPDGSTPADAEGEYPAVGPEADESDPAGCAGCAAAPASGPWFLALLSLLLAGRAGGARRPAQHRRPLHPRREFR